MDASRIARHWLLVATLVIAVAAQAAMPIEQGRALLRENRLEQAADALERAVAASPRDAEAHHLLGVTYGRQALAGSMLAKMQLAGRIRDHFERAVELAPDSIEYRESLLQFYAQAPAVAGGGADKARAQAAEIARRDAVSGEVAYATIARIEGKHDEALARLKAAQARRPTDSRLGIQVGIQLQELKRYDEAFACFEGLTQRDPAAMGAWYQFGRTAVLARKRLAEGESALQRYLRHTPGEQDPPLAAAHWRLGMLYELMQRETDARVQYAAAIELDPKHDEARAALKRLQR